jgi:mannose-1-phosphate guanylyltransferase
MRGFVLAAGFGTRLRPITEHLPKALVTLAGKPLLGHALDFLHERGVTTIGVNTHYLPELIEAYRSATSGSFEIFHETPEIRGTGGALHFARPFLEADATFIVINVDIVARFDLEGQIQQFMASDDFCRLLAWRNDAGTGTIVFNTENGRYIGAANEVGDRNESTTADFIGMALYRRDFLKLLTPDDFSIVPVWRRAIERGLPVSVGLIGRGYWRDIGTPKSLAQAHFDIIDGHLDIAPPASFYLDRKRLCCYPARWNDRQADRLGNYCWIEDPSFAPFAAVAQTVVVAGAIGGPQRPLRNTLLTRWGELSFDE